MGSFGKISFFEMIGLRQSTATGVQRRDGKKMSWAKWVFSDFPTFVGCRRFRASFFITSALD
jgi:hypothetical protein